MHTHPAHDVLDLSLYARDRNDPPTKYGLPAEVKFCKRCVISNQRPNSAVEFKHTAASRKATIHFDEDGVCDACHVTHEKHHEVDWQEREHRLAELCDRFRSRTGAYDCIVPGSGGKDSVYAAWVMKHKYAMNPLTVTWAPHLYTDWGWKNFQAWIHSGFDNYLFTPNGRIHRLLTRLAVENLYHPFQPFIIGQKAFAPKMALLHQVPLIIYGENEAEYGNPRQDANTARRSYQYFAAADEEIYLGGTSVADLKAHYGVTSHDLLPYMPAKPEALEALGAEVHYLGYYLKWHPQSCYYHAVEHTGFQASPERTPGTYSKYNSIDDKIDDLHYYTTCIKFGIGRATYDAAQEIRSQDITREEGVALVRRFDGEFPERFFDELMEYLSLPPEQFPVASAQFEQPMMDRDYFVRLADRFRPPHLWLYEDGRWRLRHTVAG